VLGAAVLLLVCLFLGFRFLGFRSVLISAASSFLFACVNCAGSLFQLSSWTRTDAPFCSHPRAACRQCLLPATAPGSFVRCLEPRRQGAPACVRGWAFPPRRAGKGACRNADAALGAHTFLVFDGVPTPNASPMLVNASCDARRAVRTTRAREAVGSKQRASRSPQNRRASG
jgi:hypothetical protein